MNHLLVSLVFLFRVEQVIMENDHEDDFETFSTHAHPLNTIRRCFRPTKRSSSAAADASHTHNQLPQKAYLRREKGSGRRTTTTTSS